MRAVARRKKVASSGLVWVCAGLPTQRMCARYGYVPSLSKEKPFVGGGVCAPRRMWSKILVSRVRLLPSSGLRVDGGLYRRVSPEGSPNRISCVIYLQSLMTCWPSAGTGYPSPLQRSYQLTGTLAACSSCHVRGGG